MVGVPRSKGCRICVQRRVKCDLTTPTCNNCRKGNRPCPGYDQDLKFQDEGAKLRRRFEKKAEVQQDLSSASLPIDFHVNASSSGSTETPQWPSLQAEFMPAPSTKVLVPYHNAFFSLLELNKLVNPETVLDTQSGEDTKGDGRTPTGGRINFDETFQFVGFSPMRFSPNLAQEQLLSIFISAISPSGQVILPRQMHSHNRWLSNLPGLTGRNLLLDTAVRAVSLAHLGRVHGSETFLNESRPYYGKALKILNSSLSDIDKGMASETLSATILLSFYEMFASDSNESWVRHAGGASALMKIRGPARHRYGFDREIFMAYRHTIIIEAFQKDEACFLDEPEWRELSHQVHQDMRSSNDISAERLEIFDLGETFYKEMLEIPAVFRDARNLRQSYLHQTLISNIRDFRADIIRRAQDHRSRMKAFFAKFRACLTKANIAPTTYMSGDPVIPIYYTYVNVFLGSTCTGHWTVLILLNMVLIEMEKSSNPEAIGLYKMENRECGLEICRSAAYMLTSSFLGPFFSVFGLRMCLMVLEQKERDWVVQKLFEIGDTHMRMATHIPGFDPGTGMPMVRAAIAQTDRLVELI